VKTDEVKKLVENSIGVVQEALHNYVQRAGAHQVTVAVKQERASMPVMKKHGASGH
jgi:signal transduction histidine kinase